MAEALPPDWWRKRLISALNWLAAEPDAARFALTSRSVGRMPVAKILESLDDIWVPIRNGSLVEGDLLSILREIESSWLIDDERVWTERALETHPMWSDQRQRARQALRLRGVSAVPTPGLPLADMAVLVMGGRWTDLESRAADACSSADVALAERIGAVDLHGWMVAIRGAAERAIPASRDVVAVY